LKHGVAVAVVTAAGYEYNVEKYEFRISGLLHYFQQRGLNEEECGRFYLVRQTL
jgi:IMP and pyridine-specific 5'-nucleotidase